MSMAQRPAGQQRGGFGQGGPMGLAMPVEKAKNPTATALRLVRYFRPHALRVTVVVAAAALSSVFSIFSPKLLGNITTDLFDGFLRHRLGVGGVDFAVIGRLVLDLAVLYIGSAAFSWVQQYLMAGTAQRVVYAVRAQVMEKLGRLPIAYFDGHPHGGE